MKYITEEYKKKLSLYCSFYTVMKNEICATRKDLWVRKILKLLRYEIRI